ncbi:unnamed protein product [Mucor hiemalis]
MAITTTYLQHPLENNDGTFIERRHSISRRLSISSDLSDDEALYEKKNFLSHKSNNWNRLLSQFHSQPDIMQLIQLCKEEEDRRCQEETIMKIKEYQVYRQLQHLQQKKPEKEFHLQLPPLSHK